MGRRTAPGRTGRRPSCPSGEGVQEKALLVQKTGPMLAREQARHRPEVVPPVERGPGISFPPSGERLIPTSVRPELVEGPFFLWAVQEGRAEIGRASCRERVGQSE